MDLGRIVQIDDLVAHHLVVRDVEVNVVVRAEPRGTPVDLTHFPVGIAHLQPITELVGPIKLNRYATDDAGEQILSSEAYNDCDHAGSGKQSLQLRFSMVSVAQDQEQGDQEYDTADDLTKKMWNRCLAFLFEIEVPDVAINQSDNQRSAQQDRHCSNVIPPRSVHSIHRDGGIKRQR